MRPLTARRPRPGPRRRPPPRPSVVSDDSGVILFVLARDVDDFFATYDDEVLDFLKKYDFKGPLFKPRKNV